MKTFLAVLAALIVAFFVARSVLAQDRTLEKWRSAKNRLTTEIQLSFRRSHQISEDATVDTAITDGGRFQRESELQREGAEQLISLIEHKPGGELTEREQAELKDAKATLARMNRSEPVEDTPSTVSNVPKATPTPKPTPPSTAFLVDVRQSQRAALAKYPELGKKGSPFNARFIARLAEWNARGDQRLSRSDWPEKLADDCNQKP